MTGPRGEAPGAPARRTVPVPPPPPPRPGRPAPATVTATVDGRPRSLNAERSADRWTHRRQTDDERTSWGWAWRAALRGRTLRTPVEVAATPYLSGPMQDTGNCYPTVKAALDALVDVAGIPDDTPDHVARIRLEAPVRVPPGRDALSITVIEAP